MACQDPSSRLLLLPREIRDIIYIHAMHINSPPPTRAYRTIPPPGGDGQLYLWTSHCDWTSLNLLSVNHQTRAETRELISQLQKSNKIRFELDILAKGYVYTPKWTLQSLALQPNSSLDLHVNLSILSTEAFRRNDGWPRQPGHVFRTLINFLSRFIYLGPSFLHNNPPFSTPGPFYIKTLSLDLTFRDDYTEATHPETVHEVFRMMKALSRLDTVGKYIGRIQVSGEWTEREEEIRREAEWDVKKKGEDGEILREETWAASGFHFGEAWVRHYGKCKASGERRPSLLTMG